MIRLSIFLILALQCFSTTACDRDEQTPGNSLCIEVQRDSMIDFRKFLDALRLLVSQRRSSVNVTIGPDNKILEFISEDCVPGEPLFIHVSPDQVAIGSGLLYQPLTVDQLQKHLKEYAHAASMSNEKGIVHLYSERQVSGEFGLVILGAIVDSGIPAITLGSLGLPEAPPSADLKKPSSPASR